MGCVKDDRPAAWSQKYGICQDETRHRVGLQAPLHSETLATGARTSSMVSVFPPILPSVQRNVNYVVDPVAVERPWFEGWINGWWGGGWVGWQAFFFFFFNSSL